ncbi:MAG: hypothetical protein G8237_02515 [Magnetococcales bacterium]|nr:hypothetical protein [Magnetococcales bacterium]
MNQEQEISTTIHTMTQTLDTFHADMTVMDARSDDIARHTTRLIRMVLTILAGSSAIIMFLLTDLTDSMSAMIENMNTMYSHFGLVSKNMHHITGSVINMGDNIQGIPAIAKSMQHMNKDVKGMNGAVANMNQNIQSMERHIGQIDGGVAEMSGRFVSVTRAVNHMNYNVNQMAKPTDLLGPLGR